MQIRRTGEAEFNHPQAEVFQATVKAIEGIPHMSIDEVDASSGLITAKSSASMWTWGENLTLAVAADGDLTTTVHVTADPKLFTNVKAGHAAREDVDEAPACVDVPLRCSRSRASGRSAREWPEESP